MELSLEAPNKERIVERLNDIERRRDELLELLENLQTLYKESKEMTDVESMDQEADNIVDRVGSETRGARLFLAKGVDKGAKELLFRARAGNRMTRVQRIVTWPTQTTNSSGFEFLIFRAAR